ncbi:MAG: prephenate dehydrogenase [Clostridia bacterium]|nr:prephenate dehydrogenase [Clostridia bacterium]
MKNIGIIGLGLIGGSLAKCFRDKIDGVKIAAMNRSEQSLIDAKADGVIDNYSLTDMSIFKDCDIVFVCTSVDKIPEYVERLLSYIKKDCIITDVGSTKKIIYDQMLKFDNINFIGGHPMAGSEKTGYKSAKAHLFENAFYLLTPNKWVSEKMVDEMISLVKLIGATPLVLDPDCHDYTVAAISHVPHIIASALVNTVKELDDENHYMYSLAAGGFKDITRIASSSPEVWSSICRDNRDKILKVLCKFKENINNIEKELTKEDNLYDFFDKAREYRNTFANRNPITTCTQYEIYVDITDQPGAISIISTLLSVHNINIKNIGIINNREYSDGVLQIVFSEPAHKENAIEILEARNYTVLNKE